VVPIMVLIVVAMPAVRHWALSASSPSPLGFGGGRLPGGTVVAIPGMEPLRPHSGRQLRRLGTAVAVLCSGPR